MNRDQLHVSLGLPAQFRGWADRCWADRCWASFRSAGQPGRLTRLQVAADTSLAAIVTVACLAMLGLAARNQANLLSAGGQAQPLADGIWHHAAPLAIAARTAPLALRRLRPLTGFWLCLAACATVGLGGTSLVPSQAAPQAGLPALLAVNFIALAPAAYSAVAYSSHRALATLSLPVAVVVLAFPGIDSTGSGNYALLTAVLLFFFVLVVGNAVRLSQRSANDSKSRLRQLQAEQQDATRQAIGNERARIATELHDVVTHNVSMMVVQAGAARRILDAEPTEAKAALLAIEESGRAAIVELQHLLGLLSVPDEPHDGAAGSAIHSADAGALQPQPGLDRLRPLIDRVCATGLQVELVVRGTPRTLSPGADLAAYRVIQEALTNVVKHAGQPSTTVTLDYRRHDLAIEVANDDQAEESASDSRPRHVADRRFAPDGTSGLPGAKRGLLGMRERVCLYGGELAAGSRPGGGWLVRATFPDGEPTPATAMLSLAPQ